MKNHKITITFLTHCNTEEIVGSKKQVFKYLSTFFWNVKNMDWTIELVKNKGSEDETKSKKE